MTWKHLVVGLAILVACIAGTAYAESLSPTDVEAALGGGTYLDVNKVDTTYVRGGLSATTSGGTWWADVDKTETFGGKDIRVDGDDDGDGDGWYHRPDKGDGGQFELSVTGATPNAVYDVWLVGVGRADETNTGLGNLDQGFRWTTVSGDYSGTYGDTFQDIRYAPGAVTIKISTITTVYGSYGAKGSAQVTADGAGAFSLYIDESCYGGPSNWSWVDGVVVAEVPEPSTFVLLTGLGVLGLAYRRRR